MNSKSSFNWQANTSESREFWKKNSGKFYWHLLNDNSYKLIDLFINISGMEISGMEISERFSIPKRTVEWHISQLKQHKIVFSEKHIYPINGNTRSVAHYAVIFSGLVSLSNHLQNLNIKKWNRKNDPFRSIMKRKNEIPANPHGSTSPQWRNDENKNQLSNDSCHCGHLKKMNLIYLEYIPTECRSPGGPPLADPPCGAGKNNPYGGMACSCFDHDGNMNVRQEIPTGSFPAAPDRNKKMENSCQKGSIMSNFEQIARKPQGGSIMSNFEQIAREDQVEDKHFEKNFPNETSNSIQIAKNGEVGSSRPRPRLFVKVNDHGHASTTRQDASRGTKMKKTTLDMGFIKNELRIDSKQETRNVPNSGYEKFVDYWNKLAETKGYLPKCTKVRAGSPTKVFEKALRFFKELQNGKLFNHSRAFPLDDGYLDRIGVSNMRDRQFSDVEMFQIIENVATAYASNPTYLPKKFDAILWTDHTNAAKRDGTAHSVFLELINSKHMKHLSLGNSYDDLSEKDQEYMEYHLIPMYKNLRGVHTEPSDAEMSQLISGFYVLRSQWEEKYQKLCKNSISAKLGRIDPNFSWFVREFAHFVVDTGWKNLPLQIVFSLNQEYLGEYLDQLERNL